MSRLKHCCHKKIWTSKDWFNQPSFETNLFFKIYVLFFLVEHNQRMFQGPTQPLLSGRRGIS